jgi:hypothetical protein
MADFAFSSGSIVLLASGSLRSTKSQRIHCPVRPVSLVEMKQFSTYSYSIPSFLFWPEILVCNSLLVSVSIKDMFARTTNALRLSQFMSVY